MSEHRALYRKWRPKDFDDVQGQAGITDILKYEVANSKLSHAYLFCGSRGTGKTSCAKILSKAVNCLNPRNGNPCNECEACRSIDLGIATDVIEMDAASNNGINDVRDMQDEIAFTPALLKYRVYIIDEVHMMTTAAFNALLKTLEEPPTYVIFILATTEYHKLPTTIVSRCQRFDFRRISLDDIMARLKKIADAEGIELTDDGARVIARVARGGMRDAVSLLELCRGSRKPITAELVFETAGSGNRDVAYSLARAILNSDYSTVYKTVREISDKSGDISVFWQELIEAYRDIMIVRNTDAARDYLDLTESEYELLLEISRGFTPVRLAYHTSILEGAMADMQRAFNSKRSIAEIALTRMCDARSVVTPEALALRVEELERDIEMLKLGAPRREDREEPAVTVLPTKKENRKAETVEPPRNKEAEEPAAPSLVKEENKAEPRQYKAWSAVLARISEAKPQISVQFVGSVAYVMPDGTYLICMNAFFAKIVAASEPSLNAVRNCIAEREGIASDAVRLAIEPMDSTRATDLMREVRENIDN